MTYSVADKQCLVRLPGLGSLWSIVCYRLVNFVRLPLDGVARNYDTQKSGASSSFPIVEIWSFQDIHLCWQPQIKDHIVGYF